MKNLLRDSKAAVLHSRLLTIMVTGQIMKINLLLSVASGDISNAQNSAGRAVPTAAAAR